MFSDSEARVKIAELQEEVARLKKLIGIIPPPVYSSEPSFTVNERLNAIAHKVELLYEHLGLERMLQEPSPVKVIKKEDM